MSLVCAILMLAMDRCFDFKVVVVVVFVVVVVGVDVVAVAVVVRVESKWEMNKTSPLASRANETLALLAV